MLLLKIGWGLVPPQTTHYLLISPQRNKLPNLQWLSILHSVRFHYGYTVRVVFNPKLILPIKFKASGLNLITGCLPAPHFENTAQRQNEHFLKCDVCPVLWSILPPQWQSRLFYWNKKEKEKTGKKNKEGGSLRFSRVGVCLPVFEGRKWSSTTRN